VSVEKFLKQRAVKITVGGSYTLHRWYDAKGKPRTLACRTTRVSPFRMIVEVPVVGRVGDRISSYFGPSGRSKARSATPCKAAFSWSWR
jgi:hypothetical protein